MMECAEQKHDEERYGVIMIPMNCKYKPPEEMSSHQIKRRAIKEIIRLETEYNDELDKRKNGSHLLYKKLA